MIEKLIKQEEIIKVKEANEDSAIKIMKMYEDYKLRVEKAIEYLDCFYELDLDIDDNEVLDMKIDKMNAILKGEDKDEQ